jgi:hypothetical protein
VFFYREAELLVSLVTDRKRSYVSELTSQSSEPVNLRLDIPLTIDCDNRQTLRLVTEESVKLVTKLRHVDIGYTPTLAQARVCINVQWIVDHRFYKVLGKQKHH